MGIIEKVEESYGFSVINQKDLEVKHQNFLFAFSFLLLHSSFLKSITQNLRNPKSYGFSIINKKYLGAKHQNFLLPSSFFLLPSSFLLLPKTNAKNN
ncbi:MAG: hypothetical protein AAGJ08_05520 [Cyanobacteria bacterium P01_H01_bin.35]